MNVLEIEYTLESLSGTASKILEAFPDKRIFLFEAEMGAGKTTLIKEMCKCLGSRDNFSSPTYSLVNEYASPAGKIYHFDLYRVKSEEELFDIGFHEYLDSGNYCFIEWPQVITDINHEACVKIDIFVKANIRYLRAAKF